MQFESFAKTLPSTGQQAEHTKNTESTDKAQLLRKKKSNRELTKAALPALNIIIHLSKVINVSINGIHLNYSSYY